jgi:sugar phosphate isomerase/epimerase
MSSHRFDKVLARAKDLLEGNLDASHWCWVQLSERFVAVWDAEADPPTKDDYANPTQRLLLVALAKNGDNWDVTWQTTTEGQPVRVIDTANNAVSSESETLVHIPAAAISSFAVGGIDQAVRYWPQGLQFAECYCLLQKDAERLIPLRRLLWNPRNLILLGRWIRQLICWTLPAVVKNAFRGLGFGIHLRRPLSQKRRTWRDFVSPRKPFGVGMPVVPAIDRLAGARNCPALLLAVATALHEAFISKEIRITAIATFIPEIIASGGPGERALHAFESLVHIAAHLQKLGHPTHTIELVAGSLVAGVWPARRLRGNNHLPLAERNNTEPEEAFAATTISTKTAIARLVNQLRRLVPLAQSADVQFAIELEPSPLCAVGDIAGLRELCSQLNDVDSAASRRIGLCLDIAHWELAGIIPSDLSPDIYQRIIHVHVSDHGRGHFGDVPLGHIHERKYFAKWFSFLKTVLTMPRGNNYPIFKGSFSVELEACRSAEDVETSIQELRHIRTKAGSSDD